MKIAVLGVQYSPIGITGIIEFSIDASSNLAEAYSRASHHTRVTLLLSWVPDYIVPFWRFPLFRHLLGQCSDFLEHPYICVDAFGEVAQTLAMRGSDAIEVPSYDSHRLALL